MSEPAIARHDDQLPPIQEVPDAPDQHQYAVILDTALNRAEDIRKDNGVNLDGVIQMVDLLGGLPAWLSDVKLGEAVREPEIIQYFDVRGSMGVLVDTCRELDRLEFHLDQIVVSWWTTKRLRRGKLMRGHIRAVSRKDRQLHDPAHGMTPWWKLELCMSSWILLDETERMRTLHHLLCSANVRVDQAGAVEGPMVDPPDVEEFAATVGRFGVRDAAQVAFIENAIGHRDHGMRANQWREDARGQGLLPFTEWTAQGDAPAPAKTTKRSRKAQAAGDDTL